MANFIKNLAPKINDSGWRRVIAIGDIHGNFDRLANLWDKLDATADDLIIFLGDYVDRGAKVAEVLTWVMAQSRLDNFIFLRGNHEQTLIEMLSDDSGNLSRAIWEAGDGKFTTAAIQRLSEKNPDAAAKILNFARSLPIYHRMKIGGQEYIFVHAGLKPGIPLAEQNPATMMWIRDEFYMEYEGAAEIICGHSPIVFLGATIERNDLPPYTPVRLENKITLIDTGSFLKNGRITAVDILSGEFWQSDAPAEDIVFLSSGSMAKTAEFIMREMLTSYGLENLLLVQSATCTVPLENLPVFGAADYNRFRNIIALDLNSARHVGRLTFGDPQHKVILLDKKNPVELHSACDDLICKIFS